MAQNKKHITPENITEWLSSTGFLFPRNEVELERFEKIYGEEDFGLTGNEIDPDKIINEDFKEVKVPKIPDNVKEEDIGQYRMAARNGSGLPKHILDKIKKNQSKPRNDSPPSKNTDK